MAKDNSFKMIFATEKLSDRRPPSIAKTHRRLLVLLLFYLVLIYSNTLQAPFVWDDLDNIIGRTDLQMVHFSWAAVVDTFFKGHTLYRPLSCFTFALNYYIGGHNVTGYHIFNLAVHLVTAVVLYKTIFLLLSFVKTRFSQYEKICVAGLATILWAAHPIQTQAVTYIVQRMTSLAAMFYICGLWAYLNWRQGIGKTVPPHRSGHIKWLVFSLICFLCGVLSKQNAALFPAGVLLVELYFFNGYQKIRQYPLRTFFVVIVFLLIPLILAVFGVDPWGKNGVLSAGYDITPFTLQQRLLTEPRVLFFYISQLLYPVAARFSTDHYFQFSTSLFCPGTTVWGFLGVTVGIIVSFVIGRRYPLIGFPVLFYFTHHLAESSFIPLAMAYEHRNYLPSSFFFLPFSVVLIKGLTIYSKKNRLVFFSCFFFGTAVVFLLGIATYERNYEWRSPESLWKKGITVSPEIIRPYAALGWYYTRKGSRNLQQALWYDYQGIKQAEYAFIFEKADLWLNIARIHKQTKHLLEARQAVLNALTTYNGWLNRRPHLIDRKIVRRHMAEAYAMIAEICVYNDIDASLAYIGKARVLAEGAEYCADQALYLMRAGQYNEALASLQHGLSISPEDKTLYFPLAQALTLNGFYDRGYWFYKQYLNYNKRPAGIDYLYIAENRYLSGDILTGENYVEKYIQLSSNRSITNLIKHFNQVQPDRPPFVDKHFVSEAIQHHLCN